ncbi:DUF4349 domain-containing protein [Microbulbifer sp. 2304DJ12-6]|uniref:DUF4349 domain-containing protein n=1 Tax=Microbulbifer sp. 2304DJ12-6 TaxID=3233340 RepID=UPI0039B09DB4
MNCVKYILISSFLLAIIGCSKADVDDAKFSDAFIGIAEEPKQRKRNPYLAYEHRITIALHKDAIKGVFEKITSYCTKDTKSNCAILHSSLDTGEYSSGNIRIRILPEGVAPLINLASEQGGIAKKSTDVVDLQDAIINGNKRLEMLLQYQARLVELEKQPNSDIESLIKIAQELSKVQSDIEYAEGEKAALLQRTQMDIVHISLDTHSYLSFWGPISDSLTDFGENFSEGISDTIVAVAYLLPWLILFILLLFVLRFIWRKTRTNPSR